jgi:hypothetical protein
MGIPTGDQERSATMPPKIRNVRELDEVRAGSAASLAELREFLTQLKGRKPQDVIGIVSASLLVQSMATALGIVLGILAAFTVVPYLLYGPPQPKQPASAQASASRDAEQASHGEAPAVDNTAEAPSQSSSPPSEPDLQKGSSAMGIDEAKQADPSRNPLDSPDLDKLLDGLDP